ncbi:hypothetical protein ABRQ01_11330 [Pectobacterium aroidearum]|uniref:hypothetical protein n=1 Tax=Pectobacterium aroidearum TaxID=1201031 RepID=UPI0032EE0B72
MVLDIATLNRDVEHANNALSPIFNKEKEQKRLTQAQLIGEIGAQVMDIVRTEGELKAQKAAEAKGDATVERPKDGDPVAMWEDYKKALTESPTYKAEMQKYGTGSDFQRAKFRLELNIILVKLIPKVGFMLEGLSKL